MKTTITLPKHLFRRAEAAASKLRMSRSRLYATAIAEFLERHKASKITERLNQIYSQEPARLDPVWERLQIKSIRVTE